MLRKVVRVPEAVVHYSLGSVLLIGTLVVVGFQGRQRR